MVTASQMSAEQARQEIDAVYEHGVFRVIPPDSVDLPEGQQVRIVIESVQPAKEDDLLEAMFHFFDDLPREEVREIQEIILDRRPFFGGRATA